MVEQTGLRAAPRVLGSAGPLLLAALFLAVLPRCGEGPAGEPLPPDLGMECTWTEVRPASAHEPIFRAIWGSAPDDLWLGGTDLLVHHDGTSWTEFELPAGTADIGSLWGSDSNDIHAAEKAVIGADGQVWAIDRRQHYDGTDWTPASGAIIDPSAGWIEHFDGSQWVQELTGLEQMEDLEPAALWAVSGQEVYLFGAGFLGGREFHGYCTHYDGASWSRQGLPAEWQSAPRAVWGDVQAGLYLALSTRLHPLLHMRGGAWSKLVESREGHSLGLVALWGHGDLLFAYGTDHVDGVTGGSPIVLLRYDGHVVRRQYLEYATCCDLPVAMLGFANGPLFLLETHGAVHRVDTGSCLEIDSPVHLPDPSF